ncbi:NYN domain-containing protein [Testudinibacter sp. P80/BLE/0925]|uniref:NYN domain-containing protein n=1 Tax=Testudinibacter sp. TW-1 TaxID=3417757 RepID=UPI003D35B456
MSKYKTSFNVVEEKSAYLAVLIDKDNASANSIKAILEEVTKFGEATVKRIYGNFVADNGKWKQVINEFAIKPMQQFAYTTGKNATDGLMIIDAMDLLYKERFDGFCIVSSDSDFTALAIRLKEEGVTVYGFGKKQTPEAFRNACSQFIYVENLLPPTIDKEKEELAIESKPSQAIAVTDTAKAKISSSHVHHTALPMDIIQKIFEQSDSEWVTAASFGSTWKLLQTDFDPRNFGCKKLTDLIKKHPDIFEYEMRQNAEGMQEHMYVRLKN